MLPQYSKEQRAKLGSKIKAILEERGISRNDFLARLQQEDAGVSMFDINQILYTSQGLKFVPLVRILDKLDLLPTEVAIAKKASKPKKASSPKKTTPEKSKMAPRTGPKPSSKRDRASRSKAGEPEQA